MRLSTRFTTAIIAHVVLTGVVVAALNYRVFEVSAMPNAAERFAALTRDAAGDLQAATEGLRSDLLALRAAPASAGIARASANGGIDPAEGETLEAWRTQMIARCISALEADPHYRRCRLVRAHAGAQEVDRVIVDVEQSGGTPRVIAEAAPRSGDENLIRQTQNLQDGAVFVASVGFEQEHEGAATVALPVLDAVTAVRAEQPFGILVLTLDLRSAFARLRAAATPARPFPLAALPERETFLVDEHGDYLIDPDRSSPIGSVPQRRLLEEFPGLGLEALQVDQIGPMVINDRAGTRFGLVLASARLAGGRHVTVVEAVPFTAVEVAKRAVGVSTAVAAIVAAAAAVAFAIFLARSMSRPLVQMTKAVTAFGRGATAARTKLAVPIDASGEIGVLAKAFAGMAAEVSEKTAAMRRNAEILDVIMARMADAVLLVDESRTIAFANSAAREMLGVRAGLLWDTWMNTRDLFRADGVAPLPLEECPVARTIGGDAVDNFEFAFRVKGETRITHVIISTRPMIAAAGAKGALLVFRDVTAWKETERLLRDAQKMDAIGQLTGGIAHDFNNMLTVITGTIDILKEGVADRPKLAEIARMIEKATRRGADLTKQLLAFARRQPLEPHATDINALVLDTAKLLRPALGEAIEIETRLSDGAWPAMVDATQLSAALLNLALNARDAMPDGGMLRLSTANAMLDDADAGTSGDVKGGPYVVIAVSDTGTGIPQTLHAKVFEPYFTTKEVGKGTGLGLSMVYGFVKQSGGHIRIESEEGIGTTFELYLPRSTEEALVRAELAPAVTWPGGHEVILVVEDDALVRETVTGRLRSLGYTTIAAKDATEALALVEDGVAFDLLFTDVVMPGGMNGRELADAVTRRRPGTRVLFTSGYPEAAIVHQGRLDPDVALLNKPYRKAELAQKIREALAQRELLEEPVAG
jgi:signal transduction histidine kinase/ActR/RegA family two-component response regulator